MRKELRKHIGRRLRFTGTFERLGKKSGWAGEETTVLLKNIQTIEGEPVCDYLWFNLTKGFEALALQPGDQVVFEARESDTKRAATTTEILIIGSPRQPITT